MGEKSTADKWVKKNYTNPDKWVFTQVDMGFAYGEGIKEAHKRMKADLDRAVEMLRVAAKYIEDVDPTGLVLYDGCHCDGYCTAEDCRVSAEQIGGPE